MSWSVAMSRKMFGEMRRGRLNSPSIRQNDGGSWMKTVWPLGFRYATQKKKIASCGTSTGGSNSIRVWVLGTSLNLFWFIGLGET